MILCVGKDMRGLMNSMEKRIGILTWHNHGNFGGSLQAYALSSFLKRRGYNASIINYDKCSKNRGNIGISKVLKKYGGGGNRKA